MDPLIVLFGFGVGILVGTTGIGGGSSSIRLDYDGGWEIRVCRYISYAAFAGLPLFAFFEWRRHKIPDRRS